MVADSVPNAHDGMINVRVTAPRETAVKHFKWPTSMRVGDAAREAAVAFNYDAGGHPGFQTDTKPPRQLDNDQTVGAEHVVNGQLLELVDVGGGV